MTPVGDITLSPEGFEEAQKKIDMGLLYAERVGLTKGVVFCAIQDLQIMRDRAADDCADITEALKRAGVEA